MVYPTQIEFNNANLVSFKNKYDPRVFSDIFTYKSITSYIYYAFMDINQYSVKP